ncbi:hypothetical protein [Companilactobacillus sp.]|uniref:hypothetical protein n=1 Tax=Companilactobacillus sp. TaxID=2767905 RepID=UPI0025BD851F|nr:hypothetical protein [Companilactobacillus sp.]MCH4008873.1 hypothetical protein [Companilactobacillus sp.]MCH4050948.1 hypothetical protein [Companilactobacillus sp.]MCH4076816.1 hypothetical protein [Companilactobacillus sp.]MCH4125391.1 hypothetical protein [Companilactobacillus sp.]MCH4131933.1 hypothetical protein [Companilactobacillus sp.]
MSNKKIVVIYLFFFFIPYVVSLLIAGIAYNALVLHALTWRVVVGGVVGSLGIFAIKVIAQRPILIMYRSSTKKSLKRFIHFFILERDKVIIGLNLVVDFFLCIGSIYLIAKVLPIAYILGSSIGWLVLIMMISLTLAAYIEFDSLSIYTEKKKN